MTRKALDKYCLGKEGAIIDFPFDEETAVYKVGGKIFALAGLRSDTVNLKCDPALSIDLRASFSKIIPGYHMNHEHWNTVAIQAEGSGGPDEGLLRKLIDMSYDLVKASLPKAKKAVIKRPLRSGPL